VDVYFAIAVREHLREYPDADARAIALATGLPLARVLAVRALLAVT
jgi:hypothetical protein